jgi:hypothetical protein
VTSLEVHTLIEDQGEIERTGIQSDGERDDEIGNTVLISFNLMKMDSLPRINVTSYEDTKFCILTSISLFVCLFVFLALWLYFPQPCSGL